VSCVVLFLLCVCVCELGLTLFAPSGLYRKARASSLPATRRVVCCVVPVVCLCVWARVNPFCSLRTISQSAGFFVSRHMFLSCCVFVCPTCFSSHAFAQDYIAKRGLLRFPPHVSCCVFVCVTCFSSYACAPSGLYRKARASSFPAKRFLLCVCVSDLFLFSRLCSGLYRKARASSFPATCFGRILQG